MIPRRATSLISLIVGCGLVVVLFGCNRALTVDDVVDRNSKAMGGRAAIEAVHSIEVNLHITDPGFEADGAYYAARPGKMRIDVSVAGEHGFTEPCDAQRAATDDGKQEKPDTEKATAPLQRGVELPGKLFRLRELKQRG